MALTRLGTNAITTLPAGVGGKVLQVVFGSSSTRVSSSSSTYADVGLSASITPSSTSNKILIIVNCDGLERRDVLTWGKFNLLRDSTSIAEFGERFYQEYPEKAYQRRNGKSRPGKVLVPSLRIIVKM